MPEKTRLNVKGYATPVFTKLLMCQVCTVMFFQTEKDGYVVVSTSLRLRFLVRFLTLTTAGIAIKNISPTGIYDILSHYEKRHLQIKT